MRPNITMPTRSDVPTTDRVSPARTPRARPTPRRLARSRPATATPADRTAMGAARLLSPRPRPLRCRRQRKSQCRDRKRPTLAKTAGLAYRSFAALQPRPVRSRAAGAPARADTPGTGAAQRGRREYRAVARANSERPVDTRRLADALILLASDLAARARLKEHDAEDSRISRANPQGAPDSSAPLERTDGPE